MKKSFKILLASLLAVIMVISASPLNGFADSGWINFNVNANAASYSGTCGSTLTWDLNADTGEMVISGTGKMTEFSSSQPWAEYMSLIKSVTVEEGVKSVSGAAFSSAENLETVTIADSMTVRMRLSSIALQTDCLQRRMWARRFILRQTVTTTE